MPMLNRTPPALAAFAAALLLAAACGQAQEGTLYRTISPAQPPATPGKIEVVEFFSYACPHCGHFYPLLNEWAARQPKDVVLRRVPVGFNREQWINLQRAYYALQADGDLEKLDGAFFKAIHEERKPLFDESSIADWVGRNGGSAEKFAAAYTGFNVNNETVQADGMAAKYGIDSVPTVLANLDKVIARVRAERPAPRAKHKSS
jgi:protein dithiol oxidoreductase (disulfide-forming)